MSAIGGKVCFAKNTIDYNYNKLLTIDTIKY